MLSKKFRGKFLSSFKEVYYTRKPKMVGNIDYLTEKYEFQNLVDSLHHKNWAVYCNRPFKNAYYALEYLGWYTHKFAISNSRLEYCQDGLVVFKWKDYKDKNKILWNTEQQKHKYKTKIMQKTYRCSKQKSDARLSTEELILKLTEKNIFRCSCCNGGG